MNNNFNMNKIYMNKLEAKIKELEEENKELKELNVCVGCEDNSDYKARIDKAIEYLEEYNLEGVKLVEEEWYRCIVELLDILKRKW